MKDVDCSLSRLLLSLFDVRDHTCPEVSQLSLPAVESN